MNLRLAKLIAKVLLRKPRNTGAARIDDASMQQKVEQMGVQQGVLVVPLDHDGPYTCLTDGITTVLLQKSSPCHWQKAERILNSGVFDDN